jgi:hypothetical protein
MFQYLKAGKMNPNTCDQLVRRPGSENKTCSGRASGVYGPDGIRTRDALVKSQVL